MRRFGIRRASAVLGLATVLLAGCYIEVNIVTDDDADEQAQQTVAAPIAPEAAPTPPAAPGVPSLRLRERPRRPPPPVITDPILVEPSVRTAEIRDLSVAPTFTPYTVAPSLLNRSEIVRAMEREYPQLLKDAGISGTVRIYFFINALGQVERTLVDRSSGHQALDEAALRVARLYRFQAARYHDVAVPVWVSFPITFQVR